LTPEGELLAAIEDDDIERANRALDNGADTEILFADGKPLLRVAAESGRRKIRELLVAKGADVNQQRGARKFSLLHNAVACSNYGSMSILLDLGADPSPRSSNNSTPLHVAARTGQGYSAERLISCGAEINACDDNGRTPLHWAVEKNDLTMVKLLLQHNCDVNIVDRRGRLPSIIAMKHPEGEIIELLVRHGAACPDKHGKPWSDAAGMPNEARQNQHLPSR